jgi:hypothetical protein
MKLVATLACCIFLSTQAFALNDPLYQRSAKVVGKLVQRYDVLSCLVVGKIFGIRTLERELAGCGALFRNALRQVYCDPRAEVPMTVSSAF